MHMIVLIFSRFMKSTVTCCRRSSSVARYDIRYEKEDFLLRIKKASVSDQGTFTCLAENRVGKVEASAYLTIRGG